jgi:hypothetical protein
VDKQPSVAAIELAEHRRERGVSQVGAADIGEHREARDVEAITAVRDLGECSIHVRQRKRSQEPEPAGVVDGGATARFVHLAGEVDSGRTVAEVHTG